MTLEDRLLLIKAGYTKEEIEGMSSMPPTEPTQEPAPEDAKPSDPLPEPEPKDPEPDAYAEVMSEIKKLKDAIIKQNIQQKTSDPVPQAETADDILASILDPNFKNRKELS